MIVVTMNLSSRQLALVKQARPAPHVVSVVQSTHDAQRLLRTEAADVFVVDPSDAESSRVDVPVCDLVAIAAEFPYFPVVFYVSNPVRSLSVVARFPSRERCDALVAGVDDNARAIGAALESVVGSSLVGKLLRAVGLTDERLPAAFRRAIRQVFTSPHVFRDVDDIATAACMSRRTLDRWLTRYRVLPAAEVLHVARAFLAIRWSRDEGNDRDRVYEACGLQRSNPISSYVSRATGESIRSIATLQDSELIAAIAKRLERRPEKYLQDSSALTGDAVSADESRELRTFNER
jgi:hypothetical protein